MGRLPKATDPDLCKRLHDSHSGSPFFPRPDPRKVSSVFNVLHYAGVVSYSVANFLHKNNDTVHKDLLELGESSSTPLLASVFAALADAEQAAKQAQALSRGGSSFAGNNGNGPSTPRAATAPARDAAATAAPATPARGAAALGSPDMLSGMMSGGMTQRQAAMAKMQGEQEHKAERASERRTSSAQKTFSSVGMTFMKQMNGMVAELNSTRCNFIRCLKPNYQMELGLFDVEYTVLQLRHTGMLQPTRTRAPTRAPTRARAPA